MMEQRASLLGSVRERRSEEHLDEGRDQLPPSASATRGGSVAGFFNSNNPAQGSSSSSSTSKRIEHDRGDPIYRPPVGAYVGSQPVGPSTAAPGGAQQPLSGGGGTSGAYGGAVKHLSTSTGTINGVVGGGATTAVPGSTSKSSAMSNFAAGGGGLQNANLQQTTSASASSSGVVSSSSSTFQSNPAHPQHTRSHGPAATTSASAQHHQTGPGAAHPNPSAGTATGGQPAAGGRTSSGVQGGAETAQSGTAAAGGKQELSSYAFFAKYTYTTECALLAYNFHDITNQLGIFEFFSYKHDHRLVSVTLAYLFYKYQIHHCDMALDLALTLTYLEDLSATELLEFQDGDAFNVICYLAFLAHVFNADRTIRLKDWYNEIGWRHFTTLKKLNAFVFFLFSKVRKFKLQVSESRVKKYIQKLCSVPTKS
mmetsp:Transcript_24454/g.61497  ORF Transcript_24454/g.61497 Transcript_24454/m.61497 type:complete len:425 (-) Transcript_24454:397-1671(-)|eukprot:CAMPEP_0178993912 /NCGR_PEP_ID=MMETSP0795-20121207/6977_1 /TAXON_ID=88552 /ORGANISM="Amoebophrya sp., Strain Ameob2" /LENGTH=424 /DNA_ID=CAMNT_0020686045 /DNA_START=42 /DNA_END=1316 /DNA_ORIENTATION=-